MAARLPIEIQRFAVGTLAAVGHWQRVVAPVANAAHASNVQREELCTPALHPSLRHQLAYHVGNWGRSREFSEIRFQGVRQLRHIEHIHATLAVDRFGRHSHTFSPFQK
jgi:hypothetical protein